MLPLDMGCLELNLVDRQVRQVMFCSEDMCSTHPSQIRSHIYLPSGTLLTRFLCVAAWPHDSVPMYCKTIKRLTEWPFLQLLMILKGTLI